MVKVDGDFHLIDKDHRIVISLIDEKSKPQTISWARKVSGNLAVAIFPIVLVDGKLRPAGEANDYV